MMKDDNYVERLANNIESTLDMSSSQMEGLTRNDLRTLLKDGYFNRKKYTYAQTEPSENQLDVLQMHYRKEVTGARWIYTGHKTGTDYYVAKVKKNKIGRYYDAKTGRFVRSN